MRFPTPQEVAPSWLDEYITPRTYNAVFPQCQLRTQETVINNLYTISPYSASMPYR